MRGQLPRIRLKLNEFSKRFKKGEIRRYKESFVQLIQFTLLVFSTNKPKNIQSKTLVFRKAENKIY